jgi:hypothetical protein
LVVRLARGEPHGKEHHGKERHAKERRETARSEMAARAAVEARTLRPVL